MCSNWSLMGVGFVVVCVRRWVRIFDVVGGIRVHSSFLSLFFLCVLRWDVVVDR